MNKSMEMGWSRRRNRLYEGENIGFSIVMGVFSLCFSVIDTILRRLLKRTMGRDHVRSRERRVSQLTKVLIDSGRDTFCLLDEEIENGRNLWRILLGDFSTREI